MTRMDLTFSATPYKKGVRLVRKKILMSMRVKIRLHTRRSQGVGITTVIDRLNPILRGWFKYFKHVERDELKAMDGNLETSQELDLRWFLI